MVPVNSERITIPPPSLIRERIAANLNERRILASLLRVSVQAAEAQTQGYIRERFIEPRPTAAMGTN